jgi:TRAP-type C4-dicarboxylate transport system permease small subunit
MESILQLDSALFRLEKKLVALILGAMGVVMFLSVSHRAGIAMTNPQDAPAWISQESWPKLAPFLVAGIFSVVSILACSTRKSPKAVQMGLAIGCGLTLAEWLFVTFVPNGLIWAQSFALSLLLWLSLLGASLAAHDRRHLALDIGSKLWPESWRGKVAAVGHALSAVFCLGILVLAVRSVEDHLGMWVDSDRAAGVLSGTRIPKWFAAAAIPYGGIVLAFRFFLDAYRSWTNTMPDDGDETLHQLGIQADGKEA